MINTPEKTRRSHWQFFILNVCLISFSLFIAGCSKKEKLDQMEQHLREMNPGAYKEPVRPKPGPAVVDIEDVARMVVARSTGNEKDGEHEYEIVIRGTDGRNEKLLAKRYFCRFTDNDLVIMEEKNLIFYVGKPGFDSSEGVWEYNYASNSDKLLVAAEIGMGALQISKDRKSLYYVTGGEWFKYDFSTGKKKSIHQFDSRSGATINPEGTLAGGSTEHSIFIDDVKTKKRYEWEIKNIAQVIYSKNLKHACYFIWYPETNTYDFFYTPIKINSPLQSNKIPQGDDFFQPLYYLSQDGIYLYVNCVTNLYRINTLTQELIILPTLTGDPFHLIEE